MDRYQKVEKPRLETPIDENEIRITSQGRMRSYITYAMNLLQEKGSDDIVFKAMGRAINKTVTMVELIKRRIVGLHQITSITSTDITDTWEPLEEGLLPLETTRHVSMITVTLSKKELDTKAVGYQPPIPADQVKLFTEIDYEGGEGSPNVRGRGRGGRGRGRSRGAYGNGFMGAEYDDGGYDRARSYGRGRGRGRGRYFRGRGRGNYNNSQYHDTQYDAQQDGGYNPEPPAQGRGRGRGGGYNNSQHDDGGYNLEAPPPQGRGRGRGGGYNNSQHEDGGYNPETPPQGRVRGRGGYNNSQYEDVGYKYEAHPPQGRGRGRGGGYNNSQYEDVGYQYEAHPPQGRGRGRGGYNNYQYDDGGYNHDAPPQGRGRGRGRGPRARGRGGFRSNGPVNYPAAGSNA